MRKFAVRRSPFAVRVGFPGKDVTRVYRSLTVVFLLEYQENARSQIDFAFSLNS